MKTVNFIRMLFFVMALSVSLSSCGGDDEADPIRIVEAFSLNGTRWTFNEKFEEEGVLYTNDYFITFSSATAVFEQKTAITEGANTITQSTSINYAYTYSDGLVVFTPAEAGKAYLEGVISSNIKMVVTNVSSKKQIGTFYKQ